MRCTQKLFDAFGEGSSLITSKNCGPVARKPPVLLLVDYCAVLKPLEPHPLVCLCGCLFFLLHEILVFNPQVCLFLQLSVELSLFQMSKFYYDLLQICEFFCFRCPNFNTHLLQICDFFASGVQILISIYCKVVTFISDV